MGGTGVALGRDGAAPFLNPATMTRIGDTRLAFSVHLYRYAHSRVEDLVRIPRTSGGFETEDFKTSSLSGVPSSFCAFVTLAGLIPEESRGWLSVVRGSSGRTKLGLCGATIERETLDFSAENRTFEDANTVVSANLAEESTWQRQSLGPSLSYQLTDRLALGASLHFINTTANKRESLSVVTGERDTELAMASYERQLRASALDGATTLGITYQRGRLTHGLSLRLPSIRFSESARLVRFEAPAEGAASLGHAKGKLSAPLPPVIAWGTGLEWQDTSLEFDVVVGFGGRNSTSTRFVETTLSVEDGTSHTRVGAAESRGRSAVSFRVGGETFLSPSVSLLGGLRYEPSRIVASLEQHSYRTAPSDQSMAAVSLGLGSYGRGSDLLIGTELSSAWGRLPVMAPSLSGTEARLVQRHTFAALVVLSGSVGLSSVKAALHNLRSIEPRRGEPNQP